MKATYIKTQLNSIITVSKVVTIHDYEFDKSFVFEGESHNFWEMVYVDRGQVEIQREDERLVLSQGEIIFHAPNEFHSVRALNSSPNFFVISFVSASPAMQSFVRYHRVLDKSLKPHLSAIISEAKRTFDIPKNDPYLKKLLKKKNAPIGAEQLIKTYLEQLLIFFIRNMTSEGEVAVFPSKEKMEMHLVGAVKKIIAYSLDEPVRVDAICNALGYSKSYLSKLFREQTGDTIAHYAISEKIKQAKLLIREGELNFSEISDKLSFDNPQYFSRVFKRMTDMTPTEFKASLKAYEE
ncbi:MAG: helix-turn-helix transcriptional regulator [Clostridia bacterium]|nr:helix-turn-helix transcriptional regulator [Clostridia bacterium]